MMDKVDEGRKELDLPDLAIPPWVALIQQDSMLLAKEDDLLTIMVYWTRGVVRSTHV